MSPYRTLSHNELIQEYGVGKTYSKKCKLPGSYLSTRDYDIANPDSGVRSTEVDIGSMDCVNWSQINNVEISAHGFIKCGNSVLCGTDVAGLNDSKTPSPRLGNISLDDYLIRSLKNANGRHPDVKNVKKINDLCLILVRPGDHIFGHWLIDLLPLIQLLTTTHDLREVDVLISERAPAFAQSWLLKLGFKNIHILDIRDDLVELKQALVFTPTRQHHDFRYNFKGFASWLYDSLDVHPEPIGLSGDRIFLTRSGLRNRTRSLLNRDDVEQKLAHRNFNILRPENLSLSQQRYVFEQTRWLVGEFGSAMHNSLFCSADSGIVCLQSDKNRNRIQSTLCGQLSQKNYSIHGLSIGSNYTADYVLAPEFVDHCLDEILD